MMTIQKNGEVLLFNELIKNYPDNQKTYLITF